MDIALAIEGKDFVLLVCEKTTTQGLTIFNTNTDKLWEMDESKLMALTGENNQVVQFGNYIQKNMQFQLYSNNRRLSIREAANFTRTELAKAIRKGAHQVNCLIAGMDQNKPALYWLDYLGTLVKVRYGCHGFAERFCPGIFHEFWRQDMSLDDAIGVIKHCINELNTRLVVGQNGFLFKVVDANGIRVVNVE